MKRILTFPLYLLIFIYIIFEELIWERIAKPITKYIHSFKIFQSIEVLILKLHVYIILVLFLVLLAIAEVLGIMAFALIGKGLVASGVILYISKIPLVSLTFWLFKISKDNLLTIKWFNSIYTMIIKILDMINGSKYYVNTMEIVHNIKVFIKDFYKDKNNLPGRLNKVQGFFYKLKKRYLFIKNR